jgi:hypothetical protein
MIGKDGSARTVAGPDSSRIKDDIHNILQLIVVRKDAEGNSTIVAFDEYRRKNKDEPAAALSIDSITFGGEYQFLLLMGHWERDYEAEKTSNGVLKYNEDASPTLLAAGLKEMTVTGSGTITVVMWPIVVDTEFAGAGSRKASPSLAGNPTSVSLAPVSWTVTWTVLKGNSGDGFDILKQAQKAVNTSQLFTTTSVKVSGDDLSPVTITNPVLDITGNHHKIILDIPGDFTSRFERLGRSGWVNFNLKYVPFGLTESSWWTDTIFDDAAFRQKKDTPEWIIRNGVNDAAQNEKTNFNAFHHFVKNMVNEVDVYTENLDVNGNGAVSFVIVAEGPGPYNPKDPNDPYPPYTGDPEPLAGSLVIKDGRFEGLKTNSSTKAYIGFTTAGYEDKAEVYYAVVDGGAVIGPKYSVYTKLCAII